MHARVHVHVCVCVCVYIYIYMGVKGDWDFQISDLVKTLMELIFNPYGEFCWSLEGPVSQIHSPHLHIGAPGMFSDLLRSVQMLKREWGAESNGKLLHLFIHSNSATLVPEFAVEDLPLGRILWWWWWRWYSYINETREMEFLWHSGVMKVPFISFHHYMWCGLGNHATCHRTIFFSRAGKRKWDWNIRFSHHLLVWNVNYDFNQ